MALVPIFHGRVSMTGLLSLQASERERRSRWLRTLAGADVEVLVREVPRQRTLDQNAYIHAVPVYLVAMYTGETIDKTKRDLMGECWGWKEDAHTGELIPVKSHTADMSDADASYFIEWAGPWAFHTFDGKLEIPLPGDVEFD